LKNLTKCLMVTERPSSVASESNKSERAALAILRSFVNGNDRYAPGAVDIACTKCEQLR
jgi:hypothetical protein